MLPISEQLRRHSVALISLAVAISSFAYNTWRNEQSEANRNIRTAGIALLIKLGELDRIVLHAQYGSQSGEGEPETNEIYVRSGWAFVLTVRDLGSITREPAITSSNKLFDIWNREFAGLGERDGNASMTISEGIDRTRKDILQVISALD